MEYDGSSHSYLSLVTFGPEGIITELFDWAGSGEVVWNLGSIII